MREVSHVTLRYVTLRIRHIIMLTNTHHFYLPHMLLSFPHHGIQFSKSHLIINLPSLSVSPTYLLLITTLLKQNRHELNVTTLFDMNCVGLCTVSGGFMLDFTSKYKKFLPNCCQKETLLFV